MPVQLFPARFSLRTLLIATAVCAIVLMTYTVWRTFSPASMEWQDAASLQEVLDSDNRVVTIVLVSGDWMPQTSHRYADAIVSGLSFRQYVHRRPVRSFRLDVTEQASLRNFKEVLSLLPQEIFSGNEGVTVPCLLVVTDGTAKQRNIAMRIAQLADESAGESSGFVSIYHVANR